MKRNLWHLGFVLFFTLVVCVSCTGNITETTNPTGTINVPENTDDDPDPIVANNDDQEGSSTDGTDGGTVVADQIGFGDCDTEETQAVCVAGGGTWANFSDGCRDSCYAQTHADTWCTQSFTWGCECGENRCWDGCTQTCADLP